MSRLYQPSEVAAMLGVHPSTLRAWMPNYTGDDAKFLSEYANRGRRQFTARDVAVLKVIKQQLDENATHDEIVAKLPALVEDIPEDDLAGIADETPASDAAAQGATVALVMATQQLADQSQRLTQQDAQIAALTEAVYSLRNDLARLQRDYDALQRVMEALEAKLAATEGKVDSVGEAMHRHSGLVQRFGTREG